MLELREINLMSSIKRYIELSYEGDEDLLNLYHIDKYSLDEAVNEELRRIEIMKENVILKFHGITDGENRIGYLCTFQNNLFSFCINKKYRTSAVLGDFWDKVKEVLGDSFISMLYPNNTRAIKFLKSCGMVEVEGVEDNCVTLLNVK